jgi:hypothetical protein
MTPINELHVVYGSGPVGTAVVEILLAQGRPVTCRQQPISTGARSNCSAKRTTGRDCSHA